MNPLKVLRGASLMTPVAQLARQGEALELDWTGHHLLTLDASSRPLQAQIERTPAHLVPYSDDLNLTEVGQSGRTLVMASPQLLMERIIAIRHATGRPVLLCEGDRLVGVVSDDEIYRGMLRTHVA
jgi:glycine betaine/proline transport system ATP-binding protein